MRFDNQKRISYRTVGRALTVAATPVRGQFEPFSHFPGFALSQLWKRLLCCHPALHAYKCLRLCPGLAWPEGGIVVAHDIVDSTDRCAANMS